MLLLMGAKDASECFLGRLNGVAKCVVKDPGNVPFVNPIFSMFCFVVLTLCILLKFNSIPFQRPEEAEHSP